METLSALEHALEAWGWDEGWAASFGSLSLTPVVPARVVAQHRGRWIVAGRRGELAAGLTGRLRRAVEAGAGMPAVGDWVACEPSTQAETRIDAVLPRRSAFRRRAAGSNVDAQVVAANVDTLFVATSLNRELNPRRLERYVSMARESGAEPVVVLTKSDLVDDAGPTVGRLAAELRVAVTSVSSVNGLGLQQLGRWLLPGRTVALVGSSGVGKSTLLNAIAGAQLQETKAVRRADDRGRHATTHRELFRVPGGALVLDTPGMRELGIWAADDGVESTFAEIAELAERCRFPDCRHDREPGCAVQEALAGGEIDEGRLRSYRRLAVEAAETSEAERRAAARRFARMVRGVSAESMARKTYGGGRGRYCVP